MKKTIIVCAVLLALGLTTTAYAANKAVPMQGRMQNKGQFPFAAPQTQTKNDTDVETETKQDADTNRPEMGEMPQMIDFDTLASDGVISQDTLDKIKTFMESNKPADLPEKDGETTEGTEGQMPQMNGHGPQMNGRGPQMNGRGPQMNGQRPEMNGETAEDAEGQTTDENAPADLPERPEMDGEGHFGGGLLKDLLDNEIITEEEYTAICEAIAM